MAFYKSKQNIRPRVDGTPVLIEAGDFFDEDLIDPDTLKVWLDSGDATCA